MLETSRRNFLRRAIVAIVAAPALPSVAKAVAPATGVDAPVGLTCWFPADAGSRLLVYHVLSQVDLERLAGAFRCRFTLDYVNEPWGEGAWDVYPQVPDHLPSDLSYEVAHQLEHEPEE